MLTWGRGGGQKSENLADIICERPLRKIPPCEMKLVRGKTRVALKEQTTEHISVLWSELLIFYAFIDKRLSMHL